MPEPHILDSKTDKALETAKRKLLEKIDNYASDADKVLRWSLAYAVLNGTAPPIKLNGKQ
jgi:hypothetical protein